MFVYIPKPRTKQRAKSRTKEFILKNSRTVAVNKLRSARVTISKQTLVAASSSFATFITLRMEKSESIESPKGQRGGVTKQHVISGSNSNRPKLVIPIEPSSFRIHLANQFFPFWFHYLFWFETIFGPMVFGGNGVSLNDLGLLASLFTFCIVYLFTLFNLNCIVMK